jgi:hypothetical protein
MYGKPWRGDLIVRKHGTGEETGVVFEHVLPLWGSPARTRSRT